jgi:hypothetical protein
LLHDTEASNFKTEFSRSMHDRSFQAKNGGAIKSVGTRERPVFAGARSLAPDPKT